VSRAESDTLPARGRQDASTSATTVSSSRKSKCPLSIFAMSSTSPAVGQSNANSEKTACGRESPRRGPCAPAIRIGRREAGSA